MKNWRTRKGLYMVREISNKSCVDYPMILTGDELNEWVKSHNESYGYIPGVGGDKSYTCFAWLLEYKD